MDDKTKTTNGENQHECFGELNLKIHYTLSPGVADQLGDKIERAVLEGISKQRGLDGVILIDGALIRIDTMWHKHSTAQQAFHPAKMMSIHLSHDQENNISVSRDWIWF